MFRHTHTNCLHYNLLHILNRVETELERERRVGDRDGGEQWIVKMIMTAKRRSEDENVWWWWCRGREGIMVMEVVVIMERGRDDGNGREVCRW